MNIPANCELNWSMFHRRRLICNNVSTDDDDRKLMRSVKVDEPKPYGLNCMGILRGFNPNGLRRYM